MDGVHDAQRLKELQALPLERKIMITQTRIMEWYQEFNGNVYVSFSGGKDSTVLLHIARKMFPDIPAVFSNTGLEYYEIQRFAKQHDNVTFIAPKIRFDQVVSQFGYPLISKEVAEAIYYARRINSQSVQVERERERAEPKSGASATNCLAQGAGTSREQTNWKRLEMRGGRINTLSRREQRGTAGLSCKAVGTRRTGGEQTCTRQHTDKSCAGNTQAERTSRSASAERTSQQEEPG